MQKHISFQCLSIAKIDFYANDQYNDIIFAIFITPSSITKMVKLLLLCFLIFFLNGCGQSGDLYLPNPPAHPAPAHHAF